MLRKKREQAEVIAIRKLRLAWIVARERGLTMAECGKITEQAEVEYRWVKGGEALPEEDLA